MEENKKIISCQTCGKEVAKSAKTCPHCGAKNRKPIYKRFSFYLLIIFALIIMYSGNDTEPVPEIVYNIGNTISTDKFELVVTSVETKNKVGTKYFNSTPSECGIYVAVQWKCKNISNEPISSWDLPTIYLYDSNNTRYSTDIDASSNYATEIEPDRKVFSDLNPNITTTYSHVFEIAKENYENDTWTLQINADENVKVKIK